MRFVFKIIRLVLVVVCCQLIKPAFSFGQEFYPDPLFRHFSVSDGLPSSEVHEVLQDKKGYLWFATDLGVVRYNGYEFKTFGLKDGLTDNSILDIYEDYKGRIWFISFSGRLSYYQNDSIYRYAYSDNFLKGLNVTIRSDFYVDKNDNVYIGLFYEGYFKISKTGKVEHFNEIGDMPQLNIFQIDSLYPFSNVITDSYTKSNSGLKVKYDLTGLKMEKILPCKEIKPHFKTFVMDNDIVSYIGPIVIRANTDTVKRYQFDDYILSAFPESGSQIWISFAGKGIGLYDFTANGLRKNQHYLDGLSVTSVCHGFEGGYWFSTLENGIYYLPSLKFKSLNLLSGLNNQKITSFSKSDQTIFATCNTNVIYKIDPKKENEIHEVELTINSEGYKSKSFYDSKEDKLILSGGRNVFSIDKFNNQTYIATEGISGNFIERIDDAGLLAGTLNGLLLYKNGTIKWVTRNKERFRVTAVGQFNNGMILIGGLNGLFKLNADSIIVPYDSTNQFLKTRVTEIKKINGNFCVLSTRGNGVIIISPDTFYVVNSVHQLINDNVNYVDVNGSDIWVSTNSGISQVKIKSLKPFNYTINNFSVYDGLPTPEVNTTIASGDKVYIGTNHGIYYFFPESFQKTSVRPKLYLTGIGVNSRSIRLSDNLHFKSSENNITFSVDGISYRSNGKITYRYRLQDQDTSWLYTKNPEINFIGLGAGNHLLQINAINSSGYISDQVSLEFTIAEKLVNTTWFKISLFALLSVIVFLFLKYRIAYINKREQEKGKIQQTIAELELKALRAQMNPHFTFNVMNSISYFVTHNDSISAQKYLSRFARLIRMMLDSSRNELTSLEEEIRMLNIYLELENLRFEEKFTFSIDVDLKINPLLYTVPSMFIQPFVENAIKHGLEKKKGAGKVIVDFLAKDNDLICTITDNGIGRKKAAELKMFNNNGSPHSSLSSDIAQARVDTFNRTHKLALSINILDVEDESKNNIGTRVIIQIPQNNSNVN